VWWFRFDLTGNSFITADRYRGGGSSERAKIPSEAMDGESEGILQSSFDMDGELRRPRRRSPSAMYAVM